MSSLTILVFALVAYGAFVAATTLLSQPARVRMDELCDAMLVEGKWNQTERSELEWMMASSASSSIGLLVPIAAVLILARSIVGGPFTEPKKLHRLNQDPRFGEAQAYYMVSVMACSPFAAIATVPPLLLTIVIMILRGDRHPIRVAETPVRTASATLQPC